MELINNFYEKYIQYKPMNLSEYKKIDINDKRLPRSTAETKYDENFGFPNGRKPKKALATKDEIYSAKIPDRAKDYCAHLLIKTVACQKDRYISFFACQHYREEYQHCLLNEKITAMKEFERELRLDSRNRRLKRMEQALE